MSIGRVFQREGGQDSLGLRVSKGVIVKGEWHDIMSRVTLVNITRITKHYIT
jgi:hypothetical protein